MIAEIWPAFDGETVLLNGHTNSFLSDVAEVVDLHVIDALRDAKHRCEVIQSCCTEFAFHLAAQNVLLLGYEIPRVTFDVSATGAASVLNAIAALNRKCTVVCLTSAKCFASDDQPRAFCDSGPMVERDPYGASIGCKEFVVNAHAHSFFHSAWFDKYRVEMASVRPASFVGGGDWTPYGLMPELVKAVSKSKSNLLENPQTSRPWQVVIQTLSGYLLLAARLALNPQSYHRGRNFRLNASEAITVEEFADRSFFPWGHRSWAHNSNSEQFLEAQSLLPSIAMVRTQLASRCFRSTQMAIVLCVSWCKQYLAGVATSEFCLNQKYAFEDELIKPRPV